MLPWEWMAFGLYEERRCGANCRAIIFQDFQLMWSWSTNVTDRQTDRRRSWRTTCNLNTALCTKVHRAVIIMPHWVIRWAYHLLPILLRIFVIRLRSANCTGCWHNLLWQVDLLLNVIWLKYGMNRTFLELEPQSPSPLPIGLYKNIELLLVYYT